MATATVVGRSQSTNNTLCAIAYADHGYIKAKLSVALKVLDFHPQPK